jgi:hypothetical protein
MADGYTIVIQNQQPATVQVGGTVITQGQSQAAGNIYQAIAGQSLSSGRLVVVANGKAIYFNPADTNLYGKTLGLTMQAVANNAAVDVQIFGVFNWVDNNLNAGSIYYAGPNGQLTTSSNGLTVLQKVGHAIASNKLMIDFNLNVLTI